MIEGLSRPAKSFLPDSELGSVDEVRLLDATGSLVKVLAQCDISQRCDFLTCLREDDDSASGSYCECCLGKIVRGSQSRCRGKCRWRRQGTRRRSLRLYVMNYECCQSGRQRKTMLYFAPGFFCLGLDPPINTGNLYWPDLAVKDHP
jgi:hypothetical protein